MKIKQANKQINRTFGSQFNEKTYIFFLMMLDKHCLLILFFSGQSMSLCLVSLHEKWHRHFMTYILKLLGIFLNNITYKIKCVYHFLKIYKESKSTNRNSTHHKMYHSFRALDSIFSSLHLGDLWKPGHTSYFKLLLQNYFSL